MIVVPTYNIARRDEQRALLKVLFQAIGSVHSAEFCSFLLHHVQYCVEDYIHTVCRHKFGLNVIWKATIGIAKNCNSSYLAANQNMGCSMKIMLFKKLSKIFSDKIFL